MIIEVFNAVGGAAFFQGLLREWRAAGGTVLCHAAVSEDDYRGARGSLGRAGLRWQMYGGQAWRCWAEARRTQQKADVRVVVTNPFFAPALVARTGRGRVPVINLVYDLYPEALVQAGQITAQSWIARRCAEVTRYSLRECAATVFLGEHLRAAAEKAHGPARRAAVIPVGADGAPFRGFLPVTPPADEPVRILYSGQLGRMHDFATLAAAWASDPKMGSFARWEFHASGTGYAQLRKLAGSPPGVEWGGALSDGQWQEKMKQAHVALVTMAPGAERVVMPSKAYSALVAGQALLAICPRDSDLAELVRRHDCGWVVEPGDAVALRELVGRIGAARTELQAKRLRAYAAGHEFYDIQPIAAQWLELIRELTRDHWCTVPSLKSREALV
jgi:colanic acid biosynthesis glycosyl transferase WcaI